MVALKATLYRNNNSHCWEDFGSSENYDCQLRQLTGSIASFRFKVALKDTEMSALKVDRILVFLKATVDRNANSHCWWDFGALKARVDKNVNSQSLQDFGSSGNSGCRVKTVPGPLDKENAKCDKPNSSHRVADADLIRNSVIYCVVNTKVKEIKAANSSESYICLKVDREWKVKSTPTIHAAQLRLLNHDPVISSEPVSLNTQSYKTKSRVTQLMQKSCFYLPLWCLN